MTDLVWTFLSLALALAASSLAAFSSASFCSAAFLGSAAKTRQPRPPAAITPAAPQAPRRMASRRDTRSWLDGLWFVLMISVLLSNPLAENRESMPQKKLGLLTSAQARSIHISRPRDTPAALAYRSTALTSASVGNRERMVR